MTPEQIKEALAKSMGFAIRASNDVSEDAEDHWNNTGKQGQDLLLMQAAVIYEQVKPKPLVWEDGVAKFGPWSYTVYDTYHGDDAVWVFGWSNYPSWEYSSDDEVYFDAEAQAQAAAQFHADAAHWANTALADMIRGAE